MLFMDIITWEPQDTDEVISRYSKWEYPEGIRVISEWDDLSTCRHIVIYDAESSEAYITCNFPWRDICYFDSFPIMESGECMKCLSDQMK